MYRTVDGCDEGWEFCALAGIATSTAKQTKSKGEARSGRAPHALADAFSEWLPEAPPAIDFRRCGSFS